MMLRGNKVILREKRLDDARQDYEWRKDEELAHLDATAPLRSKFSDFQVLYAEELDYPTPRSTSSLSRTMTEGISGTACTTTSISPRSRPSWE